MKFKLLSVLFFTLLYAFYISLEYLSLPKGIPYIYMMDDVYIHLEVAKNFAEHHMMSINSGSFDGASSSPFYTLLLAFFIKLFGNWPYYPLIINFLLGIGVTWLAAAYLEKICGSENKMKWIAMLMFPFFTMLYMMSIISMEHTLHMFLLMLFVFLWLKNEKNNFEGKTFIVLQIILMIISLVRFESMFLTASVFVVLFLRKKFYEAFSLLLCGVLPVVIFGYYSLSEGGMFFPNSVMLKSEYVQENSGILYFFKMVLGKIFSREFLKYLLMPTVLAGYYLNLKYSSLKQVLYNESLLLLVFFTGYLHLFFGILKYRYENYLLLLLFLVCVQILVYLLKKLNVADFKRKLVVVSSVAYFVVFSAYRFYYHHPLLMNDSANIYSNQIKLSGFLKKYYNNDVVIGNDVGAITYFTNIYLIDMYGLGTTEIAKYRSENSIVSKEEKKQFRDFMENFAKEKNAKIAVIYPEWFVREIPTSWKLVGKRPILDKRGETGRFVYFYAVEALEEATLRKNLSDYNF